MTLLPASIQAAADNHRLRERVRELTEKLVELRRESSERLDRIQVMAHAEPTEGELSVFLVLCDRCRGSTAEWRALSGWLSRLEQSRSHRP